MTNPVRARGSIVVPLSDAAVEALNYDRATPDELAQMAVDGAAMGRLFTCGVFDELNAALGLGIEEYEDAELAGRHQLAGAARIVGAYRDREEGPLQDDLARFFDLIQVARFRRTGVYFFF